MTTIKLKNGSGAPTAGDLVQGEPALDLTNKRLYTEDSGGTVIEVGTNPTSITTGDITATGTATFANLATSGDITFGDNDKAVFGAGSDLQIYHDGTDSYVDDQGTGRLRLRGASQIILEHPTNGETYAAFQANGASTLYYDNAAKLATTSTGIDVTGTVTADDITLSDADTPTLTLTDTTNTVTNIVKSDNSVGTVGTSTTHDLYIQSNNAVRQRVRSNGDISFYNDAGTSQDLYWDASTSRLGLGAGATTPSATLDVGGELLVTGGGSGTILVNDEDSALCPTMTFTRNGAGTTTNAFIKFENSGGQVAAINAFGGAYFTANVGIGTASPSNNLHVNSSGNTVAKISSTFSGSTTTGLYIDTVGDTSAARLLFSKSGVTRGIVGYSHNASANSEAITFGTAGGTERMRINATGVGIGIDSPATDLHIGDGTTATPTLTLQSTTTGSTRINMGDSGSYLAGSIVYDNSVNRFTFTRGGATAYEISGLHTWYTSGGSRAMDLDSSGNLLVGKTSSGIGTVGHELGATGYAYHTRDGGSVLDLNRKTSDGNIVKFYKDGTTVGSISVTASATTYNTSSDQRLKDNIVDAPSASDDIDAIQVRSFDWKADGSHQKYGMVAQELQSVAPDAVSEGDTEDDMMSVDYSKLVPMLVKEIQSLRARVAQLEND